jgi:nondiscriminating glutamyl-tRNA synthetase
MSLGYLSPAVVNYLGLLSWHPSDEREVFTLAELVTEFDMARVSKSPAIFDIDKLKWLNGIYMRELPAAELSGLVQPYLDEADLTFAPVQREVVSAAIQANLVTLRDAPEFAEVFAAPVDLESLEGAKALLEPNVDVVLAVVTAGVTAFPAEYVEPEAARELLRGAVEDCKTQGIKGKAIYHPLRVALSGRDQGPELFYLVAGLGRSLILERLEAAVRYMAERRG